MVCEALIFKTGKYCGEDATHTIWAKLSRPSEYAMCCRHFDTHYRLAGHQHPAAAGGPGGDVAAKSP